VENAQRTEDLNRRCCVLPTTVTNDVNTGLGRLIEGCEQTTDPLAGQKFKVQKFKSDGGRTKDFLDNFSEKHVYEISLAFLSTILLTFLSTKTLRMSLPGGQHCLRHSGSEPHFLQHPHRLQTPHRP